MIKQLAKLAELLEKNGLPEYAEQIDSIIKSIGDETHEILDNSDKSENKE